MTTAITAIERTKVQSGSGGIGRRFGAALAAIGARLADWAAQYHKKEIAPDLEALPPSRRIEAALRWHARQGRLL